LLEITLFNTVQM